MAFRFPGGDSRTTVIGASGSGKTTCGVWILAHMRFDKRPWIVIDTKREGIFDQIGIPPIQQLSLSDRPPKRGRGLYLVSPRPDEDDQLEQFLWRCWERENVGLFIDEASLMPDKDAFRAILQQGRSKHIPVIACTQRPVDVKRALFSEASYFCIYRMQDKRDYSTVQGFVPASDLARPIPPYHWIWYDVARNQLLRMAPVPPPAVVADEARERLPLTIKPFAWTSPVARQPLRRMH
jgi:hypothetical protein